jgi:nucleoside-diphosphate-sugar epimerase
MRALVTGGGRGIGAGIARALAGDGWDVVVGARSRAQVEAVAAEIHGQSAEVDVADRGSVERAVAEAGDWGCSRKTRRGRRPSSRQSLSESSRQAATTLSRGATCTPSTTTLTSSSRGSTTSASTT